MANRFFNWADSLKRFVRFDTARAEDVNDALDELSAGMDLLDIEVKRSFKLSSGTTDQVLTALPAARANKVLAFDASGNITLSANDVDTSAASAAAASTAASNAATSAANAATSASNAAASEANAAASAVAADASADQAAASAASIAGGPVASVNGMTGVVTGIATLTGAETLTNKTINGLILNDGYTEEVFAVSGTTPALSPANGSIQTWTLSGNSTPTYGTWAAGQSLILMVTAGANSVTWPTTTWSKVGGGGAAPTLTSSGATCVILWKVGTTTYGALLGSV